MTLDRRSFLAAMSALAGCRVTPPKPRAPTPATATAASEPKAKPIEHTLDVLDWNFGNEMGGEKRCTVLVPKPLPPGARLPVLVALHGLGETTDPITGANGWPRSYALTDAYLKMYKPPLDLDAFWGFVTEERLAAINDDLAHKPFGGLIVACPYLPKEIGGAMPIETYAKWLGDRLLPRIRDDLPADSATSATGIDGVSLGGFAAIRIGLLRNDLFGAIGSLQPALVDGNMVEYAAALIQQKLKGRPFRVVTSTDDIYKNTLITLDQRLTAKNIPHEFAITPGPHDYPWNKGPGAIEMLLWHDRVLRP